MKQKIIKSRNDLKDYSDRQVKRLADQGNVIAIFEYGMRLENRNQYKRAFKYLYKLKDIDNFFIWERLITLADFYCKGIISDKEIFKLLKKRHKYGVSYYSYVLAGFYLKGKGCKKSIKKYIELLKLVAMDGSCSATIELAENYEKGFGVKKSLKKAYELYYNYVDEHYRKDYWCAYKSAVYMLNRWGGAKKDMSNIEYHLRYASRVHKEAKELYLKLFNKEPSW